MNPTHLYRYFDTDGRLLYIGVSASAIRRLLEHASGKAWAAMVSKVDVQTYPTRQDALAAEEAAIKSEKPQFNIVHNRPPAQHSYSITSKTQMLAVRVPHEIVEDLKLLYGVGQLAGNRTEAVILALTCGIAALTNKP